ncbi:MAG: histidine kinase [Anaerolineae bacterium]
MTQRNDNFNRVTSHTMQFYTNSYAFVSLLAMILELAILAVMLRVKHKSTATRFLIAFFVCLLFNSLAMLWSNAGPVYQFIFIPTQDAFLIAGGVGLIGYTYHYPRYDQPREARLLMTGFSLVALIAFAYNIYFAYDIISTAQPRSTSDYFGLLMPVSLLFGIFIIARRAVHFADIPSTSGRVTLPFVLRALWHPPNSNVLALRNFALALAVGLIQAVASAELVTGILNIHFIAIGAILGISAIALAYFTHAPEPVSFMVKLVGSSLVALLIVLGINGVNLIETRKAQQWQVVQDKADNALTAALLTNQPALIPSGVRYIISWPRDHINDEAAYQLHFGRNDDSMARPAAILADNLHLMAKGKFKQPSSPGQIGLIFRDLLPSPIDYARIAAVQTLRQNRVYEVGFLNSEYFLYPVHVEAVRQSLLVIISSLFIIIIFPLFFRLTLVTPLDNLLHGIEQVNSGRLDLTLPVSQNDELGFLTHSFNRMVSSLEESRQSLQDLTQNLEQRVAARTDELAAFFDLTILAGQAVNLVDVFEQALPHILEVTNSRIICLHLLLEADYTGLYLVAHQNLPDEARKSLQSVPLTPAFKRWLQQPNDPLMTITLSQLETLPPAFHLPACQTYLGAQIRVGHQTEGILSCYRFTERGFGLDEIALVTALAEQMGLMLENYRLRLHTEEMAVLQERQRLARDLHDSVTQSLYSLSLFSRAAREAAEDSDMERLTHSLNELERNTLHALREMRLLLYELRPADLEQEGLIRAVELRLDTVERRLGLKLDVQMDEFPNMPPDYEAELYYIIVEAMNNITKHAAASALMLRLAQVDGHLHLQIADDGHGFDGSQTTGGLGLRNIQERVARLNGQLSIFSQPGCGVRLEAIIPYPVEEI